MKEKYIGEPLRPSSATFDTSSMGADEPGLPEGFIWMYKWIGWLAISLLLCVPPQANAAKGYWNEYFYLLYQYEGYHINQFFGECVRLASDLNKDGYDDILVGVYSEDIGGYDHVGRAYVYSGLDGSVLYILQGEHENAELGCAVTGIGDTDGDGYGEFLVGIPETGANNDQRGKVYHFGGKDGTLINAYCGEGMGDHLGRNLDILGDVNKDGINDFITTAEGYDVNPPPFNIGAVYVYNPVTKEMLFKHTGMNSAEGLNLNVSKTGDLNNDGYNDFASLILDNKTPPAHVGVLTLRSGQDGSTIKEFYGLDPYYPLSEVAYGGDINKDGWPDLLVGQPGKDTTSGEAVGCIYVLSGKELRYSSIFYGTVPFMFLGCALSAAGDIDDDGYDDFLAGAAGQNKIGFGGTAIVYSGKTGSVLAEIYCEIINGCLGRAVHGGKDINGDGLPDMIIGSREDVNGIQAAGKAYVYVSKSLKATDEVPLGGILELNLHVPAQPFGFYYLGFGLNTKPGVPVGTRVLPLSIDSLLLATLGNPAFSGSLDKKGKKRLNYQMPDDPGLSGLTFYGAFLTMRAGCPCGVGTISNPEEIKFRSPDIALPV